MFLSLFFCSANIAFGQESRSFDGTRNNLSNIDLGSVGQHYTRIATANYADGIGSINQDLPNPRELSNLVFEQESNQSDTDDLSDFNWAFGQFVCHDIDYIKYNQSEEIEFSVPPSDNFFDIGSSLQYFRKNYDPLTGNAAQGPREYQNLSTTFLDGSSIYGCSQERADWLRTFEGGKLKTSDGNFMPWNTLNGEYNSLIDVDAPFMKQQPGLSNQKLFVAGDERVNKNPAIIALHTVFLREHNRLCDQLADENPNWSDERLYQRARKMVGAYIQKITFNDWLPSIGILLEPFTGYDSSIDPSISNAFSAAGIVFENTLIGPELLRLDNTGNSISKGNLPIGEGYYYEPTTLFLDGIDVYLKGMSTQVQQQFDTKAITNVRNFDFADDHDLAFDLIADRVFSGRDRGLPSFNQIRLNLGLPDYSTFSNLTGGDLESANKLSSLYNSIDDLDLWVGLLAEKKQTNGMMGEVISTIIERQLRNVRDGDRFYYKNETQVFSVYDIQEIENTTLHDIIARNTAITIMQDDVFSAKEHSEIANGPNLTAVHLEAAIYPNPTSTGWVTLKLHSDFKVDCSYTILDILGRPLFTEQLELRSGDNFIKINLNEEQVGRGYYMALIESDKYSNAITFIVE